MPSLTETKSIYPKAYKLGQRSRSYPHNLLVLKTAVAELSTVNASRAMHIQTVVDSLQAVIQGENRYFYEKLDPAIKQSDCRKLDLTPIAHEVDYKAATDKIISICEQFTSIDKSALVLAAWAHDLGVPFGIEWNHAEEGRQVVNQMLQHSPFLETLTQLVLFHGFYMDLTKAHLPADITALPKNLRSPLFIIDFCDSVSRIRNGEHSNPIGLDSLLYMLRLSDHEEINSLRQPAKLLNVRFHFGFAAPIHNESLAEEDRQAMFAQAQPDISTDELTNFYGGYFRCHFFNLMLSSLNTPVERGFVLASVYRTYKQAGMTGDVLLWPDIDLGRKLQVDLPGFTSRYRVFFEKYGLAPLIAADPSNKQMVFFASKLY